MLSLSDELRRGNIQAGGPLILGTTPTTMSVTLGEKEILQSLPFLSAQLDYMY